MQSDDPRSPLVEAAFDDRALLQDDVHSAAVYATIEDLDKGKVRVATKRDDGEWDVHAWIQKAVSLYFALAPMQETQAGPVSYHDKVPIKQDLAAANVRVVPGGIVRYGSFCEEGVVVMPSFVNIGARVGENTMVDTWATVGSCAQIGANVHLAGGVGIGGVLEPPGARPVIIEDDCFIGSRCIVVEGAHIGPGAVLGANTVVTASTHVIDVRGDEPVTTKGKIPANAVVIPGTRKKQFPAGEYDLPCALIIGERSESTDRKTSLNETLRSFAV